MTTTATETRLRPLDWDGGRFVSAGGPALVAVACGVAVCILGWRGVDQAAQVYRSSQVHAHGLVLWDSGWYDGNFPVGYSVLFPVLGALFGPRAVAVASAGVATWAFDRLTTRHFGRRPLASWYFAASSALPVAIGQTPYLSGEALGLAAVVALVTQRRTLAVALAGLCLLCSPLAAAFLALACVALALAALGRSGLGSGLTSLRLAVVGNSDIVGPLVVTAVIGAAIIALGVLFPGDGPFPFPWSGLALTESMCAIVVTGLIPTTQTVRIGAGVYALATFGAFVVANPVGGNAPRLATSVGLPLLACFAWPRRWPPPRRVAAAGGAALVVPFAVWQWAPAAQVTTAGSDPAIQRSYYQPLVAEIAKLSPLPVRAEIAPTKEHWEAAYVAPFVSLARGWERQLDLADNPIFYRAGALNASSYSAWLIANGVSWVALASTPLDYAGAAEGKLVASGAVRGLSLVWSNANWRLWRVDDSSGLVSGPARLTALEPDRLTLDVRRPGPITVRVRYIKYWSLAGAAACVSEDSAGWTVVNARQAGVVRLSTELVNDKQTSTCLH
jgi:hypothetical protein